MSRLIMTPIKQADCFAFIRKHHRHHIPPAGTIFQVAVSRDGEIVGVACCGRPVARGWDSAKVIEVTRLCTIDNNIIAKHAASMLYAACGRIADIMGYELVITYTLASEKGTSLRACGWSPQYTVHGRTWSCPSRPRTDKHPTEDKVCWKR